jgi:acetyl/propionyl-CoA carboxylase alpha subunit
VRWDGGIAAGDEVGVFYDPLLAKLIVWGETRDQAIQRMRRALDELLIVGLPTSQAFHRRVMREPVFGSGRYDLGYVDSQSERLLRAEPEAPLLERSALAAALAEHAARESTVTVIPEPDGRAAESAWRRAARMAGLR